MEPNTAAHCIEWVERLILDNGEPWQLEDFQKEIIEDIFAGYAEIWAVLPEGSGKTTLLAGVALYHAQVVPSAFVPIGASSREQAEILYRQAEGFVFRTEGLRAKKKSDAEGFMCQEGYRRIKNMERGSRIQVYAADDRTADGVIPSMALVDELHRHRDLRLYRTWRGKLAKRDGQILTISTAGEPGSEFEEARERIIKGAAKTTRSGPKDVHLRAEHEELVLHDWAVRDRRDIANMQIVAAANPLPSVTSEVLRKKRETPTMTEPHWMRFVCNIATRMAGDGIKPEEWDALEEKNLKPVGDWCVGFIDLGWKIDTTGLGVLYWDSLERRIIADTLVIEPPVDEADIVAGLVERQLRHNPVGWVYDPNAGGRQMAQMLDKGEHPHQGSAQFDFIEHTQDNAPMALAAVRFDEAVRAGWIRHDGNPELKRHVLNAIRKPLGGEKWKFDRPPDAKGERRAKFPIDLLTGVLMGHSYALTEHETNKEPIAVWGAPR